MRHEKVHPSPHIISSHMQRFGTRADVISEGCGSETPAKCPESAMGIDSSIVHRGTQRWVIASCLAGPAQGHLVQSVSFTPARARQQGSEHQGSALVCPDERGCVSVPAGYFPALLEGQSHPPASGFPITLSSSDFFPISKEKIYFLLRIRLAISRVIG